MNTPSHVARRGETRKALDGVKWTPSDTRQPRPANFGGIPDADLNRMIARHFPAFDADQ